MTRSKTQEVVQRLQRLSPLRPRLAIVLGSGFQGALPELSDKRETAYGKIGFPCAGVRGHAGRIAIGRLAAVPIVVLFGRAHYYEGWSMDEVTFPVRVLAELGVCDLLLTNASGGINPRYRPGDFVALKDHVNLIGANPLRNASPIRRAGFADPGERFVDLTAVYDLKLRKLLQTAARRAGTPIHEGVYFAVSGPSYETPAEIRAFRRLGADLVGMSTVPEAIVARQCAIRVAGLACVTNLAAGLGGKTLSHSEVLATGLKREKAAMDLLRNFVALYAEH